MATKQKLNPKKREDSRGLFVPIDFQKRVVILAAERDEFIGQLVMEALVKVYPELAQADLPK